MPLARRFETRTKLQITKRTGTVAQCNHPFLPSHHPHAPLISNQLPTRTHFVLRHRPHRPTQRPTPTQDHRTVMHRTTAGKGAMLLGLLCSLVCSAMVADAAPVASVAAAVGASQLTTGTEPVVQLPRARRGSEEFTQHAKKHCYSQRLATPDPTRLAPTCRQSVSTSATPRRSQAVPSSPRLRRVACLRRWPPAQLPTHLVLLIAHPGTPTWGQLPPASEHVFGSFQCGQLPLRVH